MKTLLILSVLVLAACGHQDGDPTLTAYLKSFQTEAVSHGRPELIHAGIGISFEFVPGAQLTEGAGECVRSLVSNRVLIDQDGWKLLNDAQREELMFHELSHCILGRGHLDGMVQLTEDRQDDVSLMASGQLPLGSNYTDHREYYLNELFSL